jgi:hypothetical protein
MALLDDHDLVGVTMSAPAMVAHFRAGAPTMMVAATLDDDGFGAGDRRRDDGGGDDGANDVSKLLHEVLQCELAGEEHHSRQNVPREEQEISEQPFRVVNNRRRISRRLTNWLVARYSMIA